MKHIKTAGFTIIETLLFLAITGALVAGVMTGVGVSLNAQRYKDSVETFKSQLQGQYSELSSVQNTGDKGYTCNASGVIVTSANQLKGQSNCLLMGRYITLSGANVTTYPVVGVPPVTGIGTGTSGDVAALRTYTLRVVDAAVDRSTFEWAVRTPAPVSLLFIRSPESGHTFVFTSDSAPAAPTPAILRTMLADANRGERTICLNGDGLSRSNMGIYIAAGATGPSSIESRSNEYAKSAARAAGLNESTAKQC